MPTHLRYCTAYHLIFAASAIAAYFALTPRIFAQISWNITYEDVTNDTNVGFDHPTYGEARRQTLDSVTAYLNRILDHDGSVDLHVRESETSTTCNNCDYLARAGTLQFVTVGFSNGLVYEHISTGNDPASGFDGSMQVNFGYDWNTGTGLPISTHYDLFSTLLHELAHTLGFASEVDANGNSTVYDPNQNPGKYSVYDSFLQRGTGGSATDLFSAPGNYVGTAADLTSSDVFFAGPVATKVNGGNPVPVYSPSSFDPGSSISHITTPNAVMNYSAGPGLGGTDRHFSAVEMGILVDLGYNVLPDAEYWTEGAPGGTYSDSASWWRNQRPGTTDTAIFALPESYSINFGGSSYTVGGVEVETGTVEFFNLDTFNVGESFVIARHIGSTGTFKQQFGQINTGVQSIDGDVWLGYWGDGVYDLRGGQLNVGDDLVIGYLEGSSGQMSVQGIGRSVNVGQSSVIGFFGDGTLEVSDFATVNLGSGLTIGSHPGSFGLVDVTGSGQLQATTVAMGVVEGSSGRLDISGDDSLVNLSGSIDIGRRGDGRIDVHDLGQINVGGDMRLGQLNSGDGMLSISGGQIDVGDDLVVGVSGRGEVNQTTGTVNVGNGLTIGLNSSVTDASYTIADGILNTGTLDPVNADIRVGVDGSGRFTQSGGTVTIGQDLNIALNAIGEGIVIISNGSQLDITDDLLLGFNGGDAEITISGASVVNVGDETSLTRFASAPGASSRFRLESGSIYNGENNFRIGQSRIEAVGEATVTGVGTQLNLGQNSGMGELRVGENGIGSLMIADGATATLADQIFVGLNAGSDGSVTVNGGSLLLPNLTTDAFVGNSGHGSLAVINGGTVDFNDDLEIGFNAGSMGSVIVGGEGTGSLLDVRDGVGVGVSGSGTLRVLNGGTATMGNTNVGQRSGAVGTIELDGADALLNVGRLNVGGTSAAAGGTGIVDIVEGELTVANDVTIWSGGTVNLSGGSLESSAIDHSHGGTLDFTGGELNVSTFIGDLTQDGGLLTIGSSPGVMHVDGNYMQMGGELEIELSGTSEPGLDFDLLSVAGTATLNGEIRVSLLEGFMPTAGDIFEVLTAHELIGMFSIERLPELSGDLDWDIDYNTIDDLVTLSVVTPYTADFDGDGDVDGDDLVDPTNGWEARYGVDLDGGDFLQWQRQLGSGVEAFQSAQKIPEPNTWLISLGLAVLLVSNPPTRKIGAPYR